MRQSPKTLLLLAASLLAFQSADALALKQDPESIQGRMEVEAHEEYLKVRVYLTNTTDKEIAIETGIFRAPNSVFPSFSCGQYYPQAANWKGPGSRSMRRTGPTLKPGVEILYDTYIIPPPWKSPYPEQVKPLEGRISFRDLDEKQDCQYVVSLGSQNLSLPAPKPEKK